MPGKIVFLPRIKPSTLISASSVIEEMVDCMTSRFDRPNAGIKVRSSAFANCSRQFVYQWHILQLAL